MSKPLIGITLSRDEKSPAGTRDCVRQVYSIAIIEAGGLPVLLPNELSSLELLTYCHGLLLTGGGDFDPATYQAEPDGTQLSGVNQARDHIELALIKTADELQMPIFGICRGMQALSIAGNGSLIQDIAQVQREDAVDHNQHLARGDMTHRVVIDADSIIGQLVQTNTIMVNSFHHQAIAQMPEGFRVIARSDDGIIEAIEDPHKPFAIGVQWHPEDLASFQPAAQNLFLGFVQAAARYHRPRIEDV